MRIIYVERIGNHFTKCDDQPVSDTEFRERLLRRMEESGQSHLINPNYPPLSNIPPGEIESLLKGKK